MQTIELLLGSIIVILTLADVFQSVVVPRPTRRSLRLAPLLLNGMWPLWKWVLHTSCTRVVANWLMTSKTTSKSRRRGHKPRLQEEALRLHTHA